MRTRIETFFHPDRASFITDEILFRIVVRAQVERWDKLEAATNSESEAKVPTVAGLDLGSRDDAGLLVLASNRTS
jgi:hypothetical protein